MSPRARDASAAWGLESIPRDELITWRQLQLLRAGFDADLAASIASQRAIDLHALIELVERGCAPRLAARILAPLDHERTAC